MQKRALTRPILQSPFLFWRLATVAVVVATAVVVAAAATVRMVAAAATAADQNDDENEPDAGIVFKAHGKRSPHFVDSEPSYAFGQQMAAWP